MKEVIITSVHGMYILQGVSGNCSSMGLGLIYWGVESSNVLDWGFDSSSHLGDIEI